MSVKKPTDTSTHEAIERPLKALTGTGFFTSIRAEPKEQGLLRDNVVHETKNVWIVKFLVALVKVRFLTASKLQDFGMMGRVQNTPST